MERKDAVILAAIRTIELKRNRGVYTGDVISEHILPAGKCKKQMEKYRDEGFLNEASELGSNVYTVSRKALTHINAYRDLRLELEAV